MRKSNIIIILFFSIFSFYGQKEPNLSKFKTQKEKLKAWANYCDEFLSVENYKQLRVVGKKGISFSNENDNYNLSLFNFYIGVSFDYGSETDSISHYLELSEKFGRKAKNNRRTAEALRQLLVCFKNYGSTFKRERVLKELQKVIDTSKTGSYKSEILAEISDYYINKGQYEKGLTLKIDGLIGRKKNLKDGDYNDTINYGVQLVNISDLYVTMNNLPKSLEYLSESEPYLKKYIAGIAAVHKSFIAIYLKQNDLKNAQKRLLKFKDFLKTEKIDDCYEYFIEGNLEFADYYLEKNQSARALEYVKFPNKFLSKYASDFIKAQVNQIKGRIYLKQKDYSNALSFLKLAEPIVKEDSPEAYSYLQKILAETYGNLGNFERAYYHLNENKKIEEKLFEEKSKKNFSEIEAKYQNNVKKQEILNKNLLIESSNKQKHYLIAGLFLLSTIGGLLFYQSRKRKQVNQKLQVLNNDLDQANKVKARFFGILNHDLRSPVNNLIHYLHLQKESPELLDEATKTQIESETMTSAENLLSSMEDMLLWSKGQMENFKPQPKNVSVNQLFDDTKKVFSGYLHIKFEYQNPENIELFTDENYLKTIIRNLTSNAINVFTSIENPNIIWKVWQEPVGSGGNGKSFLSITDNGKGAENHRFKALYDDNEVIGIQSGLGLHLIRDLAKAIDCEIVVDSKVGVGTTFILKI